MISENLQLIRATIPENVKLVCVSKFHSEAVILEAYKSGERIFGENKVQELCTKFEHMPDDINWHFIGHLQTNKVKYLVPFIKLIHGVDSVRLLQEINKQASKLNRTVDCLLQVHIATEETKFGFSEDELLQFLQSNSLTDYQHVSIRGLMGMATFTDNMLQVRSEFRRLKILFETIHTLRLPYLEEFNELSMGMSDDYQIAIEEGSTMVRIGSKIFGQRIYS